MKLMNNIFMGLFLLIAIVSLFSAVFVGATHHYATTVCSLAIAWLFYCENANLAKR